MDLQMHIFIGIPSHSGKVESTCLLTIFRLQDYLFRSHPGTRVSLSCVVGVSIDIARNMLVARFMADETTTHLLFVDDDMGFSPSLIEKMIIEAKPITAAFCPSRNLDMNSVIEIAASGAKTDKVVSIAAKYVATGHIQRENGQFDPTASGFVRVSGIGTGVMLVERKVFELIGADRSLWRPSGDRRYAPLGFKTPVLEAFAPFPDQDGLWLSEDLSFCRRWTDLGGEIWAYIDEEITHVGRIAVKGTFRDQLDHFGGVPT
jgi:hypothetical protein